LKGIEDFHNALIQYYNDSIRLFDEYEEVLNYSQDILSSITPLEELINANVDNASSIEEVISTVGSMKDSIDESIALAEKCTLPQYMSDSHNNFLDVLKKYGSSTDDFIYALQLEDPLRVNAATYRYELLASKLQHIGDEMNKDIERQQKNMDELGVKLEGNQDELDKQLLIWQDQYKTAS
jgi:hypothetical protein